MCRCRDLVWAAEARLATGHHYGRDAVVDLQESIASSRSCCSAIRLTGRTSCSRLRLYNRHTKPMLMRSPAHTHTHVRLLKKVVRRNPTQSNR